MNYLNEISTDGKSAILIATCMNSGTEVLEYLVSNGAKYSIKDYDNKGVQEIQGKKDNLYFAGNLFPKGIFLL